MLDTYRGGYKKALLDLRNLLENQVFGANCKSKKQFSTLVKSMLNLLLTDPLTFDHMLEYGEFVCKITPDQVCKPIKEVRDGSLCL